jgi:SAM-dependent methyltransferase
MIEWKEHNEGQRRYFEERPLPRMVPVRSPYLVRHVEELVRFARLVPGERVLEIGAGMGRYTLLLAGKGLSLEGMDLSPVLLERLRTYDGGEHPMPLHAFDVAEPPEELKGRFDAVIGFFTLHHLHNLEACYRGMATLLSLGGRVAFLEPNAWNPLYYLQITFTPGMSWEGDRGMLDMRRGPVFRAMEAAGFSGLALERFGFFPPFLSNSRTGRKLESLLERIPLLRPVLPFQLFGGTLR